MQAFDIVNHNTIRFKLCYLQFIGGLCFREEKWKVWLSIIKYD